MLIDDNQPLNCMMTQCSWIIIQGKRDSSNRVLSSSLLIIYRLLLVLSLSRLSWLCLVTLYTMSRPTTDMDLISTGHSAFLKPALQQDHPARSLILRGINLSSSAKFPHHTPDSIPDATESRSQRDHRRWMRAGVKSHEPGGLWDEAESGGHDGWFNGAPFPLDEADVSSYLYVCRY